MKNEMNMTEGKLFPKLVIYAIPLIFSGILQLFYNAADLIVCGMFGSIHSTAAISSTNPLINLIVNLFLGLSVGANVLMARCFGANDREKGQKVVYTSMVYALVFGILIGAFGFFACHFFLSLMGVPDEIIELSTAYLQIYFLGLPFSMIYNFGSSILRATGDTKRPFLFLAISGIFNVGLNLLFVIVFQMDVPGVALATISAQGISAILVLICLFRNHGFFHFKLSEIKFYGKEGIEIASIGLPAGFQGVIFSLSNVLIQSSINSLGTDVMDGSGASTSLEGFVYTAMNAIAQSCVAFVSANYGAGKKKNIRTVISYATVLVFVINFIVGGIILLFRKELISLYVHTDEAFASAEARLLVITLTYFLCGFMDVFAYGLRGIGYSVTPTIISLVGACGFRILWIFTLFPLSPLHSIVGLAISYPISWILTGATHLGVLIHHFKKIDFTDRKNA